MLALASAWMLGCAHGAVVPPTAAVPIEGPEDPPIELWAIAAETFARLESEDRWNGEDCRLGMEAFERVDPGGRSARSLYMRGLVSSRCGNDDGARALYERALEVDASLCEARVAIGLAELAASRPDPARRSFTEAVRRDPRCASGYVNLAVIQAENETEREEALANLRRALAVRADYLPALNQMALVYLAQAEREPRSLSLAEVVCRQAQLIDPNYAPLYNTWGLIDVEQGDITAATAKFARAIELDPNLFAAHMNFGQITLSQRAYDDAARAFARARELRPHSYDAAIGLGVALRGRREPDAAERMYREALAIDDDRPEAYFDLAVLYQDHRDGTPAQLNEALDLLRRFVLSARGNARYRSTVQEVVRWCDDGPRPRRRVTPTCRPGRAQLVHQALGLMGHEIPRPDWTR